MTILFKAILSGLFWRFRGIMGGPFTVLFGLLQAVILAPVVGWWSLLFSLWIIVGEPSGWMPKAIKDDGDWWRSALLGLRIGGIGAIALPLSTWLQDRFGEPRISWLENPRPFFRPTWLPFQSWLIPGWTDKKPKYLLDWRGAWNEAYFGAIFSLILTLVIGAL